MKRNGSELAVSELQIEVRGIEHLGKGKYRVGFDTGVVCDVYGSEIRGMKLEAGTIITEEAYRHILHEIVGKRAKKRALHLLEKMDRTEAGLREKLLAGAYPRECVEEAIEYVKKYHYIDDSRYASNFTRWSKERLSRQQISQKLMAKGVARDVIAEAVETEYDADESAHIRKLLEKKHYDAAAADEGETRRVYQYLMRRGFRSSDILREMKH